MIYTVSLTQLLYESLFSNRSIVRVRRCPFPPGHLLPQPSHLLPKQSPTKQNPGAHTTTGAKARETIHIHTCVHSHCIILRYNTPLPYAYHMPITSLSCHDSLGTGHPLAHGPGGTRRPIAGTPAAGEGGPATSSQLGNCIPAPSSEATGKRSPFTGLVGLQPPISTGLTSSPDFSPGIPRGLPSRLVSPCSASCLSASASSQGHQGRVIGPPRLRSASRALPHRAAALERRLTPPRPGR